MRHTHSAFTLSRISTSPLPVPLLVGMLLLATGCSSTHRVAESSGEQEVIRSDNYRYSRVTQEVSGETVRVSLWDGREMKLENLYIGPDSTTGTLPQGEKKTVPTSALQEIEVINRGTGFLQGAGLGLGATFVVTLFSASTAESDFGQSFAVLMGLVASVPAALLGGTSGAVRGQREVYRFPKSPSHLDTTSVFTEEQALKGRRQRN